MLREVQKFIVQSSLSLLVLFIFGAILWWGCPMQSRMLNSVPYFYPLDVSNPCLRLADMTTNNVSRNGYSVPGGQNCPSFENPWSRQIGSRAGPGVCVDGCKGQCQRRGMGQGDCWRGWKARPGPAKGARPQEQRCELLRIGQPVLWQQPPHSSKSQGPVSCF